MPKLAVAAAVNRDDILAECLALSPDVISERLPLNVYRGFKSFAEMGNKALSETDAEWLVIVHQDVYLPTGFADRLEAVLAQLEAEHPEAAVLGVIGIGMDGKLAGRIWSSGLQDLLGTAGDKPIQVQTLDECILVIRTAANLRFDPKLPSFHLYGTDVVLDAEEQGFTSWVADLPLIHHSRPNVVMGAGYRSAWFYLRRKWKHRLPLANLVCDVTWNPLALYRLEYRIRKNARGKRERTKAAGNPAEIARQLGWELPTPDAG